MLCLRVWVTFVGHKTHYPQSYSKLTRFEDNDGIVESFPIC